MPDALKILIRLLSFVAILGGILFWSAGQLDWTMGWVYMAVYAAITVTGVLAVPLDPGLLEERTRLKEGVPQWDKWMVVSGSLLYPLAIFVVAGLDKRYSWSAGISLLTQITALLFVILGNLLSIWATAVNKFYARFVRIQNDRGHTVISTGPYRYIRHPGYLGQIIFSLASALALGSCWTLIPSALFALFLLVRTALEDRFLQRELVGYSEYTTRVHYRLLPYVW